MFKKFNLLVLIGVLAAAFVFAAPASASTGENDIACETWHHCNLAAPDPLDGIENGGCYGIGTFCYFGQPEHKIMIAPTLAEPILNGRVVIN